MLLFKRIKAFNYLCKIHSKTFANTKQKTKTEAPAAQAKPADIKPQKSLLTEFSDIRVGKDDKQQVETNGRPWKIQQLRIKSNEDLHKLWYVCLKQKNLLYADHIIKKNMSRGSDPKYSPRLGKMNITMARILTVMGERQKIREQYRQKLQQEYVEKKRLQLVKETQKLNDPDVPEINWKLIKQKYRELRKGVDNITYLQKQTKIDNQRKIYRQKIEEKFKNPIPEFTSFFQKELSETKKLKPSQQEILRSHVKNWRMLNLKQRRVILGFLNARRARDAKAQFIKQLKLLGQKIAHEQSKKRVKQVKADG